MAFLIPFLLLPSFHTGFCAVGKHISTRRPPQTTLLSQARLAFTFIYNFVNSEIPGYYLFKKMWYIHTIKYDLALRKKEILQYATTWMNLEDMKVKVKQLSCVRLFVTPWTIAYHAPPSMGFSRQEYWSGLPFPSPGDLLNPGIKPGSPALQADTLPSEPPGKTHTILDCCSITVVKIKTLKFIEPKSKMVGLEGGGNGELLQKFSAMQEG